MTRWSKSSLPIKRPAQLTQSKNAVLISRRRRVQALLTSTVSSTALLQALIRLSIQTRPLKLLPSIKLTRILTSRLMLRLKQPTPTPRLNSSMTLLKARLTSLNWTIFTRLRQTSLRMSVKKTAMLSLALLSKPPSLKSWTRPPRAALLRISPMLPRKERIYRMSSLRLILPWISTLDNYSVATLPKRAHLLVKASLHLDKRVVSRRLTGAASLVQTVALRAFSDFT